MKIFVLTSCVASKKYSISDIKEVLDKHNLPIPTDNLENEQKYKEVLKDFILPASQMYEGSFKYIRDLVTNLRKRGNKVDFYIISARYGLINENTLIIPYEFTFKGLRKKEIRERAEKLKIYENLINLVRNYEYDQSIIILGNDYLLTIFDKSKSKNFFKIIKCKQFVIFGSKKLKNRIGLPQKNLKLIAISGLGDRNKKIKEYIKNSIQ
jgi:hypothetical protein